MPDSVDIQVTLFREMGMRKIAIAVYCFLVAAVLCAGDVANFVNLGFSADGGAFAFGQYGITDAEFRAYADIFCVDVAKNDFLPGGRFSAPQPAKSGKDGKTVFDALQGESAGLLKKAGIDAANQGRALYVQAEDEPDLKKIEFRDFETGRTFSVTTHALTEGSGKSVKSSFYLIVEVTEAGGKSVRHTVGLPGLKRKSVSGYLVRRIVTDGSGKSLVFVVEKEQTDRNGSSIRFMVETLRL